MSDEARFRRAVPCSSHRAQLIFQAAVLRVSHLMFVAATEQGILYAAVIEVDPNCVRSMLNLITTFGTVIVGWAYKAAIDEIQPPLWIQDSRVRNVLRSHIPKWYSVRQHLLKTRMEPALRIRSTFQVSGVFGGRTVTASLCRVSSNRLISDSGSIQQMQGADRSPCARHTEHETGIAVLYNPEPRRVQQAAACTGSFFLPWPMHS